MKTCEKLNILFIAIIVVLAVILGFVIRGRFRLNKRIENLTGDLNSAGEEIRRFEERIQDADGTIEQLRNQLANIDKNITGLKESNERSGELYVEIEEDYQEAYDLIDDLIDRFGN